MAEIKFCENNFSHGTEVVVDKLKTELKDASIEVEPCLGQCGDCAQMPFAMVNDELVTADTPEQLYDRVKEIIG